MNPMTILMIVLIFSDFIFPVWWLLLMFCLLRKGLKAWQAWGLTALIGTAHLFVVTKLVWFNIGAYVLLIFASVPYLLSGDFSKGLNGDPLFDFWFWTMPPLFIIIVPTALLYWCSKLKERQKAS